MFTPAPIKEGSEWVNSNCMYFQGFADTAENAIFEGVGCHFLRPGSLTRLTPGHDAWWDAHGNYVSCLIEVILKRITRIRRYDWLYLPDHMSKHSMGLRLDMI